jgi:uncharacterized membrane protein YqjE
MARDPSRVPPPAAADVREPETVTGLLTRLVGELSTLFRKEIALAKAEVSQAATHAKAGAIALISGGAVLFAGLLALLAAAIIALAQVVVFWLAALIVGVATIIIGLIMVYSGKKQLEPSSFKPERTQEALRKDKEVVQRRTTLIQPTIYETICRRIPMSWSAKSIKLDIRWTKPSMR